VIHALKVMNPEHAHDRQLVSRFLQDAKTAAALRHPNIVQIFAVDQDRASGHHYIAMEYLEGFDLKKIVASRRPVPTGRKLEIVLAIAEGLGHAHSRGVVHRDIKPTNVRVL